MSLYARAAYITPDAEATGVSIATWFLASTYLIMYISRQSVKFVMLRKLELDDYFMTAAMLLALGMSVAYSVAADHGLGNRELSTASFESVQKAYYAADLLYILSICCTRLSLVVFFNNLAVDEVQKRIILALGAFSVVNTVGALFAAAFQCGSEKAWEVMSLHCLNQTGFWIAFGVLDNLSDAGIIVIAFILVWDLHITRSRKAVVIGCFAPRIAVIVASACRTAYLAPVSPHNDPAFSVWKSVVCTEVQVCLSILTACIPCIKPFFEGVEAGVWQVDHLRRQGLSIKDLYSKGYIKSDFESEESQRSDSEVKKVSAEAKSSDSIHALPTFEGGEWRGNV
ncbi:hypothetical protein EJ04DRAFT_507770 [Polyplosphaeria fusca]|uniref:Rhodopsin domain-containing protein n=1 Tax=Polyplosphaeria fusca TaxID=682080 RepID=A0A9P4RBZ9_9PLEO|nr:hypothetical protein EJ04DRAFT_507770 [Polyplosphaeria fusca]